MSEEITFSFVGDSELLARFITSSKWFRPSSQTVKQDAFIPYPHPDLSVTRHHSLSEEKIWEIGQTISDARPATLYGRADVLAGEVRKQKLTVESRPVPENLNHACISGWPADKPAQKILALELAATASFIPKPTRN
ncbi:MAG: hypothetical protein KGJ60_11130 [Verrucomicrobiota bacterium]|nr:hypothetical protein [Verrucomicrobiota bacterium]